MGTQAIVSVTENNRTILKVVVGCCGQRAQEFARSLPELSSTDGSFNVNRVYGHALKIRFGCGECLVVMDEHAHANHGMDEELDDTYREKFADPRWNPRWDRGTANHVIVVERCEAVLSEKEM